MTAAHDDDDLTQLLDFADGVDVGQGFTLLWSIGPDGARWPVLADQRQTEPQFVPFAREHFGELAPHELGGRLPDEFHQFHCGARTHAGKPCRTTVAGPGIRCRHHRAVDATSKPAPRAEPTLFDLEPEEDR